MSDSITREAERRQLIEDWARYTAERLQKSITRKKIGSSGALAYSQLYELSAAAGGDIGSVKHSFNYYGKFVDMGVGRGQKIESVKGNGEVWQRAGRKAKKWFSPTYYGQVSELRNLLAIKYGEQAANLIKENIEK